MKKIHFIAIGGKAMHNLALALSQKGYQISGSDDEIYDPSYSRLNNAGLLPEQMGWDPAKITEDLDAIILGMHARPENPELAKAIELGVKVYSYPEFLYEMSKDKTRVVMAGSHGKTTSTAMMMHVMKHAGLDIDYMVGAQIDGYETMVQLSDAEIIVLEGDEYLSSPIDRRPKFFHYHPHMVVITGIAWDHINVFPTFEIYVEQFSLLLDTVEEGGTVIYYENDVHLIDLINHHPRKDIHFIPYDSVPLNDDNQAFLNNKWNSLSLIGQHNYQNLEACRICSSLMGIDEGTFAQAIKSFNGVSRRLQSVNNNASIQVYLDYAHAPSKVKATTNAVKEWFPHRKLIACFELHTFSSLNADFLPEYQDAMNQADEAIVYYDDHTIKMKKMKSLDHESIRMAFNRSDLDVINDRVELETRITDSMDHEAIYLFMSSGSFSGLDLVRLFDLSV